MLNDKSFLADGVSGENHSGDATAGPPGRLAGKDGLETEMEQRIPRCRAKPGFPDSAGYTRTYAHREHVSVTGSRHADEDLFIAQRL
jgi:hypothetical protein